MEVKRKYPAHSKRPAAPGVATLLPFNSSAATAHPSPTPRRLSRRLDRKSTRLNSKSLRHLVCRLLLEKKKNRKLAAEYPIKDIFEEDTYAARKGLQDEMSRLIEDCHTESHKDFASPQLKNGSRMATP